MNKKIIPLSNFTRDHIRIDEVIHSLPSDEMLREVLQTFPTIEDQERLCRNSNFFVCYCIPIAYSNKLYLKELRIWECCIEKLGYSFSDFLEYYRTDVVMSWYSIVDSPIHSPRVAYDAFRWYAEALEPALKGELLYGFDAMAKKVLGIDFPLMRFEEFRNAWAVHEYVLDETVKGSKTDFDLAILLQALFLTKKEFSCKRNRHNSVDLAITQCLHCGKQFEFDLGRGVAKRPPHCGAYECKKKYEREKPSKQNRSLKSE